MTCFYGLGRSVFIILEVERIFGLVIVNLHKERLFAALVARKVEHIERKSVISVARCGVHTRRIALIRLAVNGQSRPSYKVIGERREFARRNRQYACRLDVCISCKFSFIFECGNAVRFVNGVEPNVRRITCRRLVFFNLEVCVRRNRVLTEPVQRGNCQAVCAYIIFKEDIRARVVGIARRSGVDTRNGDVGFG